MSLEALTAENAVSDYVKASTFTFKPPTLPRAACLQRCGEKFNGFTG